MKRYRFLLTIAVIALAVSACVKDIDVSSGDSQELFEVGFNLRVEPVAYTMTKAENINADEPDNFIDRIDNISPRLHPRIPFKHWLYIVITRFYNNIS